MRRMLPYVAETLRLQVWLIPTAAAAVAVAGAFGLVQLEARAAVMVDISIAPLSARAVLSTIAAAMIGFTAVVFSVTMLVLQLASSQLSPRVTRSFLRDRFNQSVLGLFVATFVFALLVLVSVDDDFVPQASVLVAIVLVLLATLVFVAYLDHMANAIRATSVIGAIGAETVSVIERLYPSVESAVDGDAGDQDDLAEVGTTVRSPHESGYVVFIDEDAVAASAVEAACVIEVLAAPGHYVVQGTPLLAVHGHTEPGDVERLADAVGIGAERSMSQDAPFGFRQLVDIALRALSPGINDPTTACEVVDQLHRLLRLLMLRRIVTPRRIVRDDRLCAVVPGPSWGDYVDMSVTDIAHAGRGSRQVRVALLEMLERLVVDADEEQRPALAAALASIKHQSSR